jgi:hypothetical protein
MGAWKPFHASSFSINDGAAMPPESGNPNPYHFEILKVYDTAQNTAVMIQYPDANNYEGKKILVYKGVTSVKLKKQNALDPHFSEKGLAPFARFEPTDEGWEQAKLLADIL